MTWEKFRLIFNAVYLQVKCLNLYVYIHTYTIVMNFYKFHISPGNTMRIKFSNMEICDFSLLGNFYWLLLLMWQCQHFIPKRKGSIPNVFRFISAISCACATNGFNFQNMPLFAPCFCMSKSHCFTCSFPFSYW